MALRPDQVAAAAALATTNDPVAAQEVPQAALFYSAQDLTVAPAPGNFLSLPAWPLGNNCWLLDDLEGDIQAKSPSGNRTMDDGDGPPSPGDGGTGGGGSTNGYFYTFDTNSLYLTITGITNGFAYINLYNATDYVYEAMSTPSFTSGVDWSNPANWTAEQAVFPSANQNPTPFTVFLGDRTNNLYFWARDWTGAAENGNAAPEWWFYYWFNSINFSDTNVDIYGDTYLFDYQNGIAPSVTPLLVLTPSVTSGNAPLTVNFTVNASGLPGTVLSVAWDWQGDGISDLITSNLSGQSYTYGAGTYFPVVTVATSQGRFSSGGGSLAVSANMLAGNSPTILVNNAPQIIWSHSVSGPVAVKANADGSVFVLASNPPNFFLYASNGNLLSTISMTNSGSGFDVDGSGNVYIAIPTANQVVKWKPVYFGATNYILDASFHGFGYICNTNMSAGNGNYQFNAPTEVAVSPDGTAIYVADSLNGRIQKFTTSGMFSLSIGGFALPTGVSADVSGGRLIVCDSGNGAVVCVANDAVTSGFALSGAARASADSMMLYATDDQTVQQFDSYSYDYFSSVPASVGLNTPLDVSIWPSQTEKRVYIADYGNNRVIGVTFPRPDPIAAWNGMIAAVANTNLNLALSYFSQLSSAKYTAEF